MAGTPYVIDSNILIRWVQPSDPDYLITESALDGLATKERFSATAHRTSPSFGTPALGIREFREKLAGYLLESDVPVAITRHGDTVGYYIPARRKRTETERAALKEAASRLQQVLASEGISEDEILADFKSWRVGKKK